MTKESTKIIEELGEIKRLNVRSVCVIFDSEKKSSLDVLRPEFENLIKTCEFLGFNVFPTDRHSTENYIIQRVIDKVVGAGLRALEPILARRMKKMGGLESGFGLRGKVNGFGGFGDAESEVDTAGYASGSLRDLVLVVLLHGFAH
jgi:hypothetical protein